MKILAIECHTTLEYDEITVFTELGHEVFSTGLYGDSDRVEENYNAYAKKEKRYSHKRPFTIPGYKTNPDWLAEYTKHPQNTFSYESRSFAFSVEFLNNFDVIYVNHNPALANQFTQLIKKPVIYNTVSQANDYIENALKVLKPKGVKIIRFFETEKFMKDSVEEDALIPQMVDPDEYKDWNGGLPEALTVCRGIPSRPIHTNANVWWSLSNVVPAKLIGPGNEGILNSIGNVDYEQLKAAYRDFRVFFNLGTKPGGMVYTCVEALMTGCPVVSVGKMLGSSFDVGGGYTNAVPTVITNGLNGFYSDNIQDLCYYTKLLIENQPLAQKMSVEARKLAIKHFSKEVIKARWKALLDTVG